MGVFDFITNQFIEVIEWTDSTTDTIVYRFPVNNQEIKMGAQLTVRESQVAIFVNEGQIADTFGPGRYELTTQNIPIMTKLKSWKYGFNSPFKAEVYFINTKQFLDQKWGTANPIMMRDPEFGMVRLRAFGIYSFKVAEPAKFLKEVFGTNQEYDTETIAGQLRRSLVSGLSDMLGEAKIPALDLAGHYDEISDLAKNKLQERFTVWGLQLTQFYIENISLPEEVERAMDKRTSMGVIGNLNQYTQFQAAEAIRDAANNPSGFAGMSAGVGAGMAMNNVMAQAFHNPPQAAAAIPQQPPSAPPVVQATPAVCTKCNNPIPAGSKFCSSCGTPAPVPQETKCVKCGTQLHKEAKFCPDCGTPQAIDIFCSNCGSKMHAGSKFCQECGTKAGSPA